MANVIIKDDSRKAYEASILKSFGGNSKDVSHREYAECIAARTNEAVSQLRKMEENNR